MAGATADANGNGRPYVLGVPALTLRTCRVASRWPWRLRSRMHRQVNQLGGTAEAAIKQGIGRGHRMRRSSDFIKWISRSIASLLC